MGGNWSKKKNPSSTPSDEKIRQNASQGGVSRLQQINILNTRNPLRDQDAISMFLSNNPGQKIRFCHVHFVSSNFVSDMLSRDLLYLSLNVS